MNTLRSKLNEQQRALWWIINGDVGISSSTIWATMMGVDIEDDAETAPFFDVPDFQRCYELLELIPEWHARLSEVALKYPGWQPFVENWGKLTQVYNESERGKPAPKLYKLIQELWEDGGLFDD